MKNRDKLRPTRAQKIAMGLPKPRKPHAATKLAEGLAAVDFSQVEARIQGDPSFREIMEDQFPEDRQ